MVEKAHILSQQADSLDEAIEILENACTLDRAAREQYSDLLSLWKRGIVL